MGIPFEFLIGGPPVSQQTRNRANLQAWRTKVRNEALAKWTANEPPTNRPVRVRITYYFDQDAPDVDNIIKPIQDALIGVVYVDDSQVVDAESHKRDLNGSYVVRGMSRVLAEGFIAGTDFLHIRVDGCDNPERLV